MVGWIPSPHLFYRYVVIASGGDKDTVGDEMLDLGAKGHTPS